MPYANPPTDTFSTDGSATTQPSWNAAYQPDATTGVAPYLPNVPTLAEYQAQRERRATTMRMVLALMMAVPLTAIAGGVMNGGLGALLAMAMTWVGIAAVVYLSHGKGFPFPR